MHATPRAFATADLGAATTAVALVGRIDRRWRLLASLAGPAVAPPDVLLEIAAERLRAADPDLVTEMGLEPDTAVALPRLTSRSAQPATIAVLAGSERMLGSLTTTVARSGWRWLAASADRQHAGELTARLLDPAVSAVVVGSGDPPGGDERPALSELAGLIAAAAQRRPDLDVVLAGSMAGSRSRFGLPPERIHVSPRASPGALAWPGLTDLLAALRSDPQDSRQAIAAAGIGLAGALDRRVEVLEIGLNGGLRATAVPGRAAGAGTGQAIQSADAALVPVELDEARLERVQGWSALAFDRHRLRDRLIELRNVPWAGIAGDGARLRLTAARAAMARLVELTPEITDGAHPDVLIVGGGAFAAAPAAATMLAVADVVRRPSALHVAYDHARLLGPLGTVEDPAERDRLLADLAGDLLLPLGSIVMPAGIRAGRKAGNVLLAAPAGSSSMSLELGGLAQLGLPAGQRAGVLIESSDGVVLGGRGRRIAMEVTGGLGGVLVDLRDVPLRMPDRRERRREVLSAWQEAVWPGDGR